MKKLTYLLILAALFMPTLLVAQIEMDDDSETEEIQTDEPLQFFQVREKAQYIGGDDSLRLFIARNMVIPDSVIAGTVVVGFVVERDGSVSNVKIHPYTKTKYTPQMAKACTDVVKKTSGHWTPTKQRDKLVRMYYSLPIRFNTDN